MKDFKTLSKEHFDGQDAEYDRRGICDYSQNGKISCQNIAEQIRQCMMLPFAAFLTAWICTLFQGGCLQ